MRFLVAVAVVLVVLFCSCTTTTSNTTYLSEIITLNLSESAIVMSKNEYSGWVTIEISGSGSSIADTFQDAFFAFQNNGYMLQRRLPEFGITINDQRIDCLNQEISLAQCPDNPDPEHTYRFGYYIGENLAKLRFQIIDTSYQDNAGIFIVTLSTEPLFTGR